MRLLACTIGAFLVAAPACAQTYDPNYPVCLQTYGIEGGYIDCGFTSLAQCAASASGRAAQCLTNPYFAHGDRKLPRQRGRLLEPAASACFGRRQAKFCPRLRFYV
jgi:Protein of unknown function (DUF3551)